MNGGHRNRDTDKVQQFLGLATCCLSHVSLQIAQQSIKPVSILHSSFGRPSGARVLQVQGVLLHQGDATF